MEMSCDVIDPTFLPLLFLSQEKFQKSNSGNLPPVGFSFKLYSGCSTSLNLVKMLIGGVFWPAS